MWKTVVGISLTSCMCAIADDTCTKPSVSVQCSGRLRDGVVAVGGETTGTTISFNHLTWELQFHDANARRFAQNHNKEVVNVTGTLRRIAGTEIKERWIVDVTTLSERDATTGKEGARLSVQGTIRATDPRTGGSPALRIDSDGQKWPIDCASDVRLQAEADSLVGQPVLLTGSLKQVTEEDSDKPVVILVRTLKRATNVPIHDPSN